MVSLLSKIREAVARGRYLVGKHAYERMTQRGILEWQAVAGLHDGHLEVECPDGWAKLVTVHFYD